MSEINSIIIVGGGSSGWFTASLLNKQCPEIDVTLIESPNVSTVGVGESTVLTIKQFLRNLNIKDEDWMPHCDATYKGSIKFTDFHKKGEYFHFPFGPRDMKNTQLKIDSRLLRSADTGADVWLLKKWMYPDTPQTDFCESYWPTMQMINKNKIHPNEDNAIPNFNHRMHWAYQLDATKFSLWLRDNLCSDTKHVLDHVTNVNLDDRGWISSLSTKEHGELSADLYIDCSGFNSVLLEKTLEVPYTSYKDVLINNGSWVTKIPYVDPNIEMELSTNGTAIGNGWVWNIPLWDRISSGYVYSDKFIDKEIALKEYKEHLNNTNQWCKNNDAEELEYRHIDIRTGIHEKAWHKNCFAVGLSYGFLEPLESTGLIFTMEAIWKLVIMLQAKDRHINQFDRDGVTREMGALYAVFKFFILYHFIGSRRDDSEYWRWYTQELETKIPLLFYSPDEDLSRFRLRDFTFNNLSDGMRCVAIGHHINLFTDMTVSRFFPPIECLTELTYADVENFWHNCGTEDTFKYWRERNKRLSLLADESPTHYEYLKEKIYERY